MAKVKVLRDGVLLSVDEVALERPPEFKEAELPEDEKPLGRAELKLLRKLIKQLQDQGAL